MVELTSVDWSDKNCQLDEMFDDQMIKKLADLPAYPMPKALKVKELYDYQIQGIRWLIHMETNLHKLPPWYERRRHDDLWHCSITATQQALRPPTLKGGILGDDMGLGKTIQTIGLILARPPPHMKAYPFRSAPLGCKVKGPRTTLIVAPLSVLASWEDQIHEHVNSKHKKDVLQVQIYHGTFSSSSSSSLLLLVGIVNSTRGGMSHSQCVRSSSHRTQPRQTARGGQGGPCGYLVGFLSHAGGRLEKVQTLARR